MNKKPKIVNVKQHEIKSALPPAPPEFEIIETWPPAPKEQAPKKGFGEWLRSIFK